MQRALFAPLVVVAACGGASRPSPAPPAAAPTPGPEPVVEAAAPAPTSRPPAPAESRIDGGTIAIAVLPAPVYVERTELGRSVSADFVLENGTGVTWRLDEIWVTAHDPSGAVAYRRGLDGNGVSPSITTIPNRELAPAAKLLLLNPLALFPRDVPLAKLHYALTFRRSEGKDSLVVETTFAPVDYQPRAALKLPLAGRVLVWDGHDFLAHHRRWDYVFAPIRAFGFDSNPGRYSLDLVHVDERGALHEGDPAQNASWLSFGKPVLAPAAGIVVATSDRMADDRQFDMGALKQDLMIVYGNHVVIDHGRGEYSLFAHLQQGSVKVAKGAKVAAGQPIAAIGASGSALFPHLHYQLQTGPDAHAEGLPAYFRDFVRVRGTARTPVAQGAIDSGDFVERR